MVELDLMAAYLKRLRTGGVDYPVDRIRADIALAALHVLAGTVGCCLAQMATFQIVNGLWSMRRLTMAVLSGLRDYDAPSILKDLGR